MANEISFQATLTIRKGELRETLTLAFRDDMDGTPDGPTPGAVSVSTDGVNVSLAELTSPGWCAFKNIGSFPVRIGLWETDASKFHSFALLGPGQGYIHPLDPEIGSEYTGTGTGTSGVINSLRMKAQGGATVVQVKAFPR